MKEQFSTPEWSSSDWLSAWNIGVGKAYRCQECGNMIMVIKGGTGTLEPRCHDKSMLAVEKGK